MNQDIEKAPAGQGEGNDTRKVNQMSNTNSNSLVRMIDGEPKTDTMIVATKSGNQHKNVLELIRRNIGDFEQFGRVAFETAPFATAGGVQRREVAQLNEQQATLLVTYLRNTEIVRKLKIALVRDFYAMRQILAERSDHQIRSRELRSQSQLEMMQAAKGLIHPDHLEAKARVVLARGLGEHAELDEDRRPLYTQDYLKERGIKGKALASTAGMFGKRVKAAYIEKHGVEPEKYPLNVKNGQTRNVLAYTEQDRHLMDAVWRQYYGETEPSAPELDLA